MRKYGLVVGSAKAAWRLLRCNPWSRGGVDYASIPIVFGITRSDPGAAARDPPLAAQQRRVPWAWAIVALTIMVRMALLPLDRAADPLDAEPAAARARDEGDPAEVQGRSPAHERGADEVLQGEPASTRRRRACRWSRRSRSSSRSTSCCATSTGTSAELRSRRPRLARGRSRHHGAGELALVGLPPARDLRASARRRRRCSCRRRWTGRSGSCCSRCRSSSCSSSCNFPAGLVIYWVTTNLWTTGQGIITRRLLPKAPGRRRRSAARARRRRRSPTPSQRRASPTRRWPLPRRRPCARSSGRREGPAVSDRPSSASRRPGRRSARRSGRRCASSRGCSPGLDKGSVSFQVVSEGERGMLGVGYAPARVVATAAAGPELGSRRGRERGSRALLRELVERIAVAIGVRVPRRRVEEDEESVRATCSGTISAS